MQAGAAAKVAGFTTDSLTGYRVAGVVPDNEWVVSKWMLQHPKYAKLIGYLEAKCHRKVMLVHNERMNTWATTLCRQCRERDRTAQ